MVCSLAPDHGNGFPSILRHPVHAISRVDNQHASSSSGEIWVDRNYRRIDRGLAGSSVRKWASGCRRNFGPMPKIFKAKRAQTYRKTGGVCWYCGDTAASVDHAEPFSRRYCKKNPFGLPNLNDISNLLPACLTCNHWKSALTLEEFRQYICARFGLETFRFYGEQFLPAHNKYWKKKVAPL